MWVRSPQGAFHSKVLNRKFPKLLKIKPEKLFKLNIELVPSTIWYSSIYQIYKKSNQFDKWDKIKKGLFEKRGRKCWICGEEDHLEAHEFWKYDEKNHIQKLVSIHHLCDLCHKIKHIGFWCHSFDGKGQLSRAGLTKEDLISHFCKINNCSREGFEEHEKEAFKIWRGRSNYKWKQDFGEYKPTNSLLK